MSPVAQILVIVAYHVALVGIAYSIAGMWDGDGDHRD
ncbi:MAG: hypothetical protein QOC57_76 [Ilumatobacteraceae bacterium]|jgi:hypothetical protein